MRSSADVGEAPGRVELVERERTRPREADREHRAARRDRREHGVHPDAVAETHVHARRRLVDVPVPRPRSAAPASSRASPAGTTRPGTASRARARGPPTRCRRDSRRRRSPPRRAPAARALRRPRGRTPADPAAPPSHPAPAADASWPPARATNAVTPASMRRGAGGRGDAAPAVEKAARKGWRRKRGAAPIGGNRRRHGNAGLGGIAGVAHRDCARMEPSVLQKGDRATAEYVVTRRFSAGQTTG